MKNIFYLFILFSFLPIFAELYRIRQVPENIPKGRWIKLSKKNKNPYLSIEKISSAVKKGDVLYVLTKDGLGVDAEIRVYRITRNKKRAYAKIRKLSKDLLPKDLKKRTVVTSSSIIIIAKKLYNIDIHTGAHFGKVIKLKKNGLYLRIQNFIPKAEKGELVFVLAKNQPSVLAEVSINKFSQRRSYALGSILRTATGLTPRNLVGKRVVRRSQTTLRVNKFARRMETQHYPNNLLYLDIQFSQKPLWIFDVMNNTNFNLVTSSMQVSCDTFLPMIEGVEWLNIFGIGAKYHFYQDRMVISEQLSLDESISANFWQLGGYIRYVFPGQWPSRVGGSVTVISRGKETLSVLEDKYSSDNNTDSVVSLDQKGLFIGAMIEARPFDRMMFSISGNISWNQKLSLNSLNSSDRSKTGSLSNYFISSWLKGVSPMRFYNKIISLETGLGIEYQHYRFVFEQPYNLDEANRNHVFYTFSLAFNIEE